MRRKQKTPTVDLSAPDSFGLRSLPVKEVEMADCRQAQSVHGVRPPNACIDKIEESGGFDRLNSQIYEFRMRDAEEAQKVEVGPTDTPNESVTPDGLNPETSLLQLHSIGFQQQWPRVAETCAFCCDKKGDSRARGRNRNPTTWENCSFTTPVVAACCPY